MKIAIINDVHIGKDLIKNDKVRVASSLAFAKLPQLLANITAKNPDILFDLGDLIRQESSEKDQKNYLQSLKLFADLQMPAFHLLGNHELWNLNQKDLLKIWQSQDYNYHYFDKFEREDYLLVWLGLESQLVSNNVENSLPKEQLIWLKNTLENAQKPVLLFTHMALDDHNTEDSFYFSGENHRFAFYQNQIQVRKILEESQKVKAVFSGHVHQLKYKKINDIAYFTLPSTTENIAGPDCEHNFPAIYTMLDIKNNYLLVRSYSDKYCFASLEVEI